MANIDGIRQASNESLSKVLNPKNFSHERSVIPELPRALNETGLEAEIRRIIEL